MNSKKKEKVIEDKVVMFKKDRIAVIIKDLINTYGFKNQHAIDAVRMYHGEAVRMTEMNHDIDFGVIAGGNEAKQRIKNQFHTDWIDETCDNIYYMTGGNPFSKKVVNQ